ncbi:TPA: hypothetical protein ACJI8N_002585 [Enterococcus hirae]
MTQTEEITNQKNQLMNEQLANEIGRLVMQNVQLQTECELLKKENIYLKDELDKNN